jgi:two-component system, cell cycle sensor histidine kinase and response regulator CckA
MEAIGRLAGGVAHDFNNLLTVINGYSEVLLGTLPRDSSARAAVEQIRKAGERAVGLTGQLLAFSRKQILSPVVLDLNQVVLNVDKMARRLIGEDVELTNVLAAGLSRVKADPGQME